MHKHGACQHGQPNYRSCDSAYTRQQSPRANHDHEGRWKHSREIVPAPLDMKGSRRDKQQAAGDTGDLEGTSNKLRRTRRISKGQAARGSNKDNHAGGRLPQLKRRRPGLGSEHVAPRGQGWRGEPTHGLAHGNLMPHPHQRRALLTIPKLGCPHQTRRPGLQLASTGSGHRRRDVAPR